MIFYLSTFTNLVSHSSSHLLIISAVFVGNSPSVVVVLLNDPGQRQLASLSDPGHDGPSDPSQIISAENRRDSPEEETR